MKQPPLNEFIYQNIFKKKKQQAPASNLSLFKQTKIKSEISIQKRGK